MKKKTIEETYVSMTETEHILARPGMWVGSVSVSDADRYIYDPVSKKIFLKKISYIPAVLKLFEEILSNSVDEYRRPANMGLTEISVTMDADTGGITVQDNGGIPVVKHKTANCWLPEFIFGRLRTSSNYDDTEKRNVVGTNGVGAALTNVFSKKYSVETADGKNKITVCWTDNMSKESKPKLAKSKKHFTKTSYILDFDRFKGLSGYDSDFISLIEKTCIDAAAGNPGLTVKFSYKSEDKKLCRTDKFKFSAVSDYIKLYDIAGTVGVDGADGSIYLFPGGQDDMGFVNGVWCARGTHIKSVRRVVSQFMASYMSKKLKADISSKGVDNKYSVFVLCSVANPEYSSQTKEEMTSQCNIPVPDIFLKKIAASSLAGIIKSWYTAYSAQQDQRELSRLSKSGLTRPDKYISCSSRRAADRELWIFEGDSARAAFRSCRNPVTQAGYVMRGVPKNAYGVRPLSIMSNDVYKDIMSVAGLKFGKVQTVKDLNFHRIVISSDMDSDGHHIAGLLLAFFNNWPWLFDNGVVVRSISPVITATKGKDTKLYYSLTDFKKDEKKLSGWQIKYTKGLGGLNNKESYDMYHKPKFQVYNIDKDTPTAYDTWFGNDIEKRRNILNGD